MQIYLIRHGMTKGNLEKRYVGTTDEGILESWKEELTRRTPPIVTSLYVSPMRRCIETCECLYSNQKYKSIEDLKELNFGEFEYKTHEELENNEQYVSWMESNGEDPFPGGESLRGFQKRCVLAFDKIIQYELENGTESIGFVVHGGTIMALLDAYSSPHKDYYHWQAGNGQGYQATVTQSQDEDTLILSQVRRLII